MQHDEARGAAWQLRAERHQATQGRERALHFMSQVTSLAGPPPRAHSPPQFFPPREGPARKSIYTGQINRKFKMKSKRREKAANRFRFQRVRVEGQAVPWKLRASFELWSLSLFNVSISSSLICRCVRPLIHPSFDHLYRGLTRNVDTKEAYPTWPGRKGSHCGSAKDLPTMHPPIQPPARIL